MKKGDKSSLNKYIALGLSGAVVFAAIVFLTTLAGLLFNLFPETLSLISDIYGWIGYDVTWFGLILGTIYGFIDGFIVFFVAGLLYKRFK